MYALDKTRLTLYNVRVPRVTHLKYVDDEGKPWGYHVATEAWWQERFGAWFITFEKPACVTQR